MLIAGHRYGFQPPQDNPEGRSITQLESRRAGECGIPLVALLRTSIADVPLSDLLDPARAPLLLAFRDEVTSQAGCWRGGAPHPLVSEAWQRDSSRIDTAALGKSVT